MANCKNNFSKTFLLSVDRNYPTVVDSMYELDESDVWNSPDQHYSPPSQTIPRLEVATTSASSLPVDIPDDSAQSESSNPRLSERNVEEEEEEEECLDGAGDRVPPHVFVMARELAKASTRVVAYSVYEGLGRTLKGRDLSKVRNAIWEITGFQD